ncbi:MAG: hypothetical protein WB919_20330 [Candidatus Sulfotelmatobacter sp.]
MIENAVQKKRFYHWFPLYGALTAFIVLVPLLCQANFDVLYIFVIGPFVLIASAVVFISALIFGVFAKRYGQFLHVLAFLAVFWVVSFLLVWNSFLLRTSARWLLWSHHYQAKVLAQPTPANGEFKHLVWEATGFAGVANQTVYLVFDPTDSLAVAAKTHDAGKFEGVPCKVRRVSRIETHWYTILFYTDEDWGKPKQRCGFYD